MKKKKKKIRKKKERKKEEKKMAIKPSILYVNVWERDESQRRTLRSVEYLKLKSRFCIRACLSLCLTSDIVRCDFFEIEIAARCLTWIRTFHAAL